jgi:hypothetical protein
MGHEPEWVARIEGRLAAMEQRLTRMEKHVGYVEEYLTDEVERRNKAVRWLEDVDGSIEHIKEELTTLRGAIYGGRRPQAPDGAMPVPAPAGSDRPHGRERFIPPGPPTVGRCPDGPPLPEAPGPAMPVPAPAGSGRPHGRERFIRPGPPDDPPPPEAPGSAIPPTPRGSAPALNPSARPYVPG